MVPTIEGEFARKRRMMVGLWDIVVGEGMISPRGYPPLYGFELLSHRLLRYLTPAAAPRRPRRQRRPARRRLGLLADDDLPALLPPRSPLWLGGAAGAVPGRPLLRPHHRLDRGRPLGPRPPRLAGDLGEGGGDAIAVPRAFDLVVSRRHPGDPLAAPARGRDRDQARQPRPGPLPPAPSRPRRQRVRDAEAADDGRGLGPGRVRHSGHPRRPAGDRHRPVPAPHLARRDPEPGQRPPRRDGARRPPSDDSRPGRRLHAAPASPPSRCDLGSPVGPRSRAGPGSPGRSGSSSTSSTSNGAARGSTCGSSPRPPGC